MKYMVTITEGITDKELDIIESLGVIIEYKSMFIPLLIVESNNISAIKGLNFVENIEEDYCGELEQLKDIQVRPTINFSSITKLLEYSNIKVCVIDSGVDASYNLNIIKSTDFTGVKANTEMHGSRVASIINLVTPNMQLLNAKITNTMKVNVSIAIKALEWARLEGANVINMSMGFTRRDIDGKKIRCKGDCPICKLVENFSSKNILVITAAGNAGPALGTIGCPGNSSFSIAVGATNLNNFVPEYSSRGRIGQLKPDIVTSGSVFIKQNNVGLQEGTSFAAPIITGVAAGIFNRYHNIHRVKEVILDSTTTAGREYNVQGKGKFDINKLKEVLDFEKMDSAN